MSDQNKPLKIEFAPGCFDGFEGSQEELDQLIKEVQTMFETLTPEQLEAQSRPLSEEDFDELPEEAKQQLARFLLDPEDQHLIPGNDRKLQ